MSRIDTIISDLEAERAETVARLEWLDEQLAEFRAHAAERAAATERPTVKPEPRSARRQTAKRASARRQTARKVKRDIPTEVIEFLEKHPSSTAGDVAKGLNLTRSTAAARLATLAKAGTIRKVDHGYSALEA